MYACQFLGSNFLGAKYAIQIRMTISEFVIVFSLALLDREASFKDCCVFILMAIFVALA